MTKKKVKVLKRKLKPKKEKKNPMYNGIEVVMINKEPQCSKHISLDGNNDKNGQVMYKCFFKDNVWRMISEEAYKNFKK